ncbi:MAG: hypothetical protein HC908_04585 [Calothrix sp. SM1_7_51]|nr:hypothetical protein [Calothrix sp. SM1_7_51]
MLVLPQTLYLAGTDIVSGNGGGTAVGNMVCYDPARGRPNSWTQITPNPADHLSPPTTTTT